MDGAKAVLSIDNLVFGWRQQKMTGLLKVSFSNWALYTRASRFGGKLPKGGPFRILPETRSAYLAWCYYNDVQDDTGAICKKAQQWRHEFATSIHQQKGAW